MHSFEWGKMQYLGMLKMESPHAEFFYISVIYFPPVRVCVCLLPSLCKAKLKSISTESVLPICFGRILQPKIRSTLLHPQSDPAAVPEGRIQFPLLSWKKRTMKMKNNKQKKRKSKHFNQPFMLCKRCWFIFHIFPQRNLYLLIAFV